MLLSIREYGVIEDNGTEHACVKELDHICVPTSVFDYLCELSSQTKKNGTAIFELEGRRKIKVDNYVGIIQTPCGHTIEILPKHVEIHEQDKREIVLANERQLLRKMLRALWKLPSPREAGSASLDKLDLPLSEWIMSRFLEACNLLLQRGVRSEYQCVAEQSAYLKGRLNIQRYLTQPVTEQHRFPIEHDIFSLNTAPNRLIKTALEKICKLTKNTDNWRLANEIRLKLSEVPTSRLPRLDFPQWKSGRLYAQYEPIKVWCEIVLGEQTPSALHGEWHGMSLLFPMEKLFEAYVLSKLEEQYSEHYQIQRQKSNKYLCHHNGKDRFNLRPDIYFKAKKDTHSNMILDTKWKLLDQNSEDQRYGISDGDMQQMFAYSYMYLEHDGPIVLIYPKSSKFNKALPEFQLNKHERDQGKNPNIWVLPFDLDKDKLIGFDMIMNQDIGDS
ncbi:MULTISPECIES: McrC family protein [Acinetobacter]|uniref:McrC family protein n=1 Tax=Acinetobacter lwoffii TaxID=28090 RepID=A0A6N1MGE0_ACILW|nr:MULTISPECIES: McrC family protein [Acinetobacter]MDY6457164.1 McrC family protein [Acinetobacter faecalis]QKU21239.1 McrC family protein [Acinetobacter lwoffii]